MSAASGYKFMEEAAVTSFYIVVLVCASVSTILPIFFSIDLVVVILVSVVAQSYFELSLELSRLRFAAKEFLIMSVARAFLTLTIVAISLLIHSYVDARVLMLLVSISFAVSGIVFGRSFVGKVKLSVTGAKKFASVGLFFCFITAGEAIVSVADKYYIKANMDNDFLVSYGVLFLVIKQGFGIFGLVLYTAIYPRALSSDQRKSGLLIYSLVLVFVGGALSILLTYVGPYFLSISLPSATAAISIDSVNWAITFGFVYMIKVYVLDMVGASFDGRAVFVASSLILIFSFVGFLHFLAPSSLNDVFRLLSLSYILSSFAYLCQFFYLVLISRRSAVDS
ncbi:hypothetical protein [Sulfitobacter pontiacus]|uniref:hypothetical protein n=1 Tax=Sulfitobacter pontiacus TaxID=60137 RepID=UPI00315A7AB4